MADENGITLSAGNLTALIVQIGTVEPVWTVTVHDSEMEDLRVLSGDQRHEEPTREDAKKWAERYLRAANAPEFSSSDWTSF